MGNILEVKNLRKQYGGFALQGISFTLEQGYIMGFIGPNGAGKTTTIKLIMNLLRKDDGEIRVFGLDHLAAEQEIKERIGFVYAENYFYDELTVAETKKIIAPFYRRWDEALFQERARQFALPLAKKVKELSKGMRMKLALVLALSHHADLILMDEPTAGLDPIVRSELLEILADFIQDEQKAVFFSTHLTTDLDKIADYITFINEGKLVFSAAKETVLENYAIVKGAKELLDDKTRQAFIGIRENKYGFEALTNDVAGVRRLWADNVALERPTLEEIMLLTVRGRKDA